MNQNVTPPRQGYMTFGMQWHPTLDNFVTGPNQKLLELLHNQIQLGGGKGLFFWGDVSVGKTHLLQGVYEALKARDVQAVYLDMAMLQPREIEALPDLVQTNDWLLLDNVHSLSEQSSLRQDVSQVALERALMVCFNEIQTAGRTLVCASSQPPPGIGLKLADLSSRLQSLSVYRLHRPSDDDLTEVLRKRAAAAGLSLPDSLIRYLLTHLPRDPGSLIAAYDRLEQVALAQKKQLTIYLAREQLAIGDGLTL